MSEPNLIRKLWSCRQQSDNEFEYIPKICDKIRELAVLIAPPVNNSYIANVGVLLNVDIEPTIDVIDVYQCERKQ